MQTFIAGTSFDAINSMAVNYVMDVIDISGSGSRTYPAGCTYQASLIIETAVSALPTSNPYQVTVSGNIVSWSVATPVRLVVLATPNTGTDSSYFGQSLYSYDAYGNKTVKLAPDFVPFCLVDVIDVPPGGQLIQTRIPVSNKIVTFHRLPNADGRLSTSVYSVVNSGGYHAFSFNASGINQTGCRIYVFSNYLVNIPDWGFFVYRDGTLVWHSNCLPLNMGLMTGDLESATPLAVTPGVTSVVFIPADPASPKSGGYLNSSCSAAGYKNGVWQATIANVFSSRIISGQEADAVKPWAIRGYVGYIDCSIYDQYYRYALGLV